MELEEFYIDQQETGFSFIVKLSTNFKLLNLNLDEFTLKFAVIDSHGNTLMDLNKRFYQTSLLICYEISKTRHIQLCLAYNGLISRN